MFFPNTAPCMLAKLPLHHKINHKKRIWTKEPISPDKKVIYWQPSQFIQAGVHWGRQLFPASLGVVGFPTLHLLPKQGSSYTLCQGLGLSWRAPSSPQPSFQHFPQVSNQALRLQNKLSPGRKKENVPRTPNPCQEAGLGSQLCNKHESVRKAENTWLFSPAVYKGRSKVPRLRSQPEDSGAQRGPAESQRTEGSRIRKLPLAARRAFYKSRGTKRVLPLLGFGPAPKVSLCRARRRKPTTRRNKGLGDSPGFGLLPLPLAAGLFPENPSWAFSFKTLSKILHSLGTAHHSVTLEPPLPLHYSTDHGGREQLYSSSWETKRKSNRQLDMHHLLNTVFCYSPASAAWCRSRTLAEENYFKI